MLIHQPSQWHSTFSAWECGCFLLILPHNHKPHCLYWCSKEITQSCIEATELCLVLTSLLTHHNSCTVLVSSPDLIRRVYRFQYNMQKTRAVLKAIRAGVGFGSGTETSTVLETVHWLLWFHLLVDQPATRQFLGWIFWSRSWRGLPD